MSEKHGQVIIEGVPDLKTCPFCKMNGHFKISGSVSGSETGFDFKVGCCNCDLYLPKLYKVRFSLNETGTIKLITDERKQAARDWNRRGESNV